MAPQIQTKTVDDSRAGAAVVNSTKDHGESQNNNIKDTCRENRPDVFDDDDADDDGDDDDVLSCDKKDVVNDGTCRHDYNSSAADIHGLHENHHADDGGDGGGGDGEGVDSEAEEDDSAIPVDRGRAWLVMMSCFLMHILVVGGGKSFGVFVQEFQDRFQVGAKELGIINGIALFLMFGLGIFVNMLAVRFSARRVVTAGSVLTSAGFVLTAFIPSFKWLYVTYGVITGLGFALSFSPTIVMVGQCFKKYRAMAIGIALSGAGIGAFGFPVMVRVLINSYGLQGCLLILGGSMLNVAVAGFMLPPHRGKTSKHRTRFIKKKKFVEDEEGECLCDNVSEYDEEKRIMRISQNGGVGKVCKDVNHDRSCKAYRDIEVETTDVKKIDACYPLLTQTTSAEGDGVDTEKIQIKIIDADAALELEMKTPLPLSDKVPLRCKDNISERISLRSDYSAAHENSVDHNDIMKSSYNDKDIMYYSNRPTKSLLSKSANFLHVVEDPPRFNTKEENNFQYHQQCKDSKSVSTSRLSDPLKPRDFLSVHDNNNMNTRSRSHNKISASLAYMSNCDLAMHSQGNLERLSLMSSRSKVLRSGERGAKGKDIKEKPALFEWSLLTNPPFIMHFFSAYLGYGCYITNLFMLADYASACGLDRDTAALTLSVVGILELVARLTFPPITEILCCRRRTSWGFSLVIMGLLNLAVPYMKDLSSIMIYAVLFGYACGCFTALIPILCAEIKGPEKMGSSFGLTTIGMGLAVMTGPPLSGTIKDMTGHWDHGFVTMGCLALVSATLAFLEPFVQTRWNARHEKKQENNEQINKYNK